MSYRVLTDTELETPGGIMELKAGQMIRLAETEAIPLIEAGLITPAGRVAYKVYSNILQAFLWVVQDDAGAEELKAEGISEPIYTGHKIKELKKLSRDDLKAIHEVKQVFDTAQVKDVKGA